MSTLSLLKAGFDRLVSSSQSTQTISQDSSSHIRLICRLWNAYALACQPFTFRSEYATSKRCVYEPLLDANFQLFLVPSSCNNVGLYYCSTGPHPSCRELGSCLRMVQMESFEVFVLVEATIILHHTLNFSQLQNADHVAHKEALL